MFFTIWTVTKFKYDRAMWAAYFMDEKDAMSFAKGEVKKIDDDELVRHVKHYYDGSKLTSWDGFDNEVYVDNECWVEDNEYGKIVLNGHTSGKEFDTIDALKAWCKESQEKVINNK